MLFNLLETTTTPETPKDNTMTYIIMAVIVVAIIGLFVWQTFANKKKRKEAQEMMNNLQPGIKIKTIGGICGYLVEVNDAENTFILETGTENNKCYIKFDKGAIYQTGSAAASTPATPVKTEEKPVVKEEVKVEEPAPEVVEAPVEETKTEE
ncbi:MAG: preprotein translocase subunit YajC [Clostridiales bacterium]|nr:preprotein translocase subunit YajC [Clostridiales bacterium]